MPYSVLLLDIRHDGITAELQWPLKELQVVFPDEALDSEVNTLLERKGAWLDTYLRDHVRFEDHAGHAWTIAITGHGVRTDEQNLTGPYNELVFQLQLTPPQGESPRHFTLRYDAIMHELVTHKLFIKLRSDWDGGLSERDSTDAALGVLGVSTYDGTISPVVVDLDDGSRWKGFKSMVMLGIDHIAEGTDHLLFLFVLILPCAYVAQRGRWSGHRTTRQALLHLLKIVTAFTIGHSVSLILGAMKWVNLPPQPVEVAIALTILITAAHALRPLFPGREMLVAAGFGVIHGSAFATVLYGLDLDGGRLALSILGFNLGIELMQLFAMLCTVPWLILISRRPTGKWLRIIGASLAIVAALGWMLERIIGEPNVISTWLEQVPGIGKWFALGLAALALISRIQANRSVADSD